MSEFSVPACAAYLSEHEDGRPVSQYTLIEQQIRMYIRSSDALIVEISMSFGLHYWL
jgi:hypothetical protein